MKPDKKKSSKNGKSFLKLVNKCLTVVVILLAVTLLWYHEKYVDQQRRTSDPLHYPSDSTDNVISLLEQERNLHKNDRYSAEAKKEFENMWKELSPVDKRNLYHSIERIPSYTCRKKVIESYLTNLDGFFNEKHELFNFESQCPSLTPSDDDKEENEKEAGTHSNSPLYKKKQVNAVYEHRKKKNVHTSLHDKLMASREAYIANPESILPLVPKDYFQINLAYVLLLHNNLEHVKRLINRIYHPNFYYVLHVDKKAPKAFLLELNKFINKIVNSSSNQKDAKAKSNIIIHSTYSVTWGGPNMVLATMESIKLLYEIFGDSWDYCINLSGADYPLKSNEAIIQELAVNAYFLGKKNVSYLDMYLDNVIDNKSIKLGYTECENYLYLSGWRPLPKGIEIWTGSQWFILHNDFCKFLMEDENLVAKFLDYCQNMVVSDELFFQTILKASPFCHDVIHHNFRLIKWGDNTECFFDRIADACGRHPDNFAMSDLPMLKLQPENLFARKFENNMELIDELDRWIQRPMNESRAVGTFYLSVADGICLTAVDENTIQALPCKHMTSSKDTKKQEEIYKKSHFEFNDEQEWIIGPCSDPNDVRYDEDDKCIRQSKNSTVCVLINKKYNRCLDYEGSDEPSSHLILWPCHFQEKQLWKFAQSKPNQNTTEGKQESCSIITNQSTKILTPDLCVDLNKDLGSATLWPCAHIEEQSLIILKVT